MAHPPTPTTVPTRPHPLHRQRGLAAGPLWAVIFAVAAVGGWVMYFLQSQAEPERTERAAADDAGERRAALQRRLQEARETQQELRQRLTALREGQDRLQQELEAGRAERQSLGQDLEAGRAEKASLEQALDTARAERDRLRSRLEQAQKAGAGSTGPGLQRLMEQRDALQDRLESSRADSDATEAEHQALAQQLQAARREVEEKQAEQRRQAEEFERLRAGLKQELQAKQVRIEELEQGRALIRVDARVLFDSGSAWLRPEGQRVLDHIARLLNAFPERRVRVAGHTDTMPIGPNLKDRYPSNWELSTARAAAAVRYLEYAAGVDPGRLAAVGYAEHQPVASNDSRSGRARNRRIEFRLLPPEPPGPVRVVEPEAR